MFIIDFDDTLFDTQKFKKRRLEAVRDLGVDDDLYWETYIRARDDKTGTVTYTNERHAMVLAEYGLDRKEVLEALESTMGENLKDLLFPDAVEFLEFVKSMGKKAILLSLGQSSFQEDKVKSLDIEKYFDTITYVDDSKENIVRDIMTSLRDEEKKDVWFINDKVIETRQIVRRFENIKAVLKISPVIKRKAYEESSLPYFETLTEIKEYVQERKK